MSIQFNTNALDKVYFNGNELDKVYFNGDKVYEAIRTVTVNIIGQGSTDTTKACYFSYVSIDGVIYPIGQYVTVNKGTTISIYGKTGYFGTASRVGTKLNGTQVGVWSSSYSNFNVLYSYTVTKDCNITLASGVAGAGQDYYVEITDT